LSSFATESPFFDAARSPHRDRFSEPEALPRLPRFRVTVALPVVTEQRSRFPESPSHRYRVTDTELPSGAYDHHRHRVPVVRVSDIEMSPRPIRCYRFVVEFPLSPNNLWDSRVSSHGLLFPGHCGRVFAEPESPEACPAVTKFPLFESAISRCHRGRFAVIDLSSSFRCHRVTFGIAESRVTACCSRVTAVEFFCRV